MENVKIKRDTQKENEKKRTEKSEEGRGVAGGLLLFLSEAVGVASWPVHVSPTIPDTTHIRVYTYIDTYKNSHIRVYI